MTVAIVRSDLSQAADALSQALDMIEYRPSREAVFIKPNVPDYGPPGVGLFTDPAVVEGLLRYLAGRPVVIGEGAIVGRSATEAFRRTGYAELAKRYGAQVVDLNDAPRTEVDWEFGKLKLPALIQTHEYINVAKMKTHVQTGVSLGMKNQKGLLAPADKKRFHKIGLDGTIRALAEVVRPQLTVVDGIGGLEGLGPWRFGTPMDMGVLVAGADMMEVDNVCVALMGMSHHRAPHIPLVETIHTVGAPLSEVKRAFRLDYPGFFRYHNIYEHISDSCSGCNAALYLAFRSLRKSRMGRLRLLLNGQLKRTDIVLGSGSALPRGHGRVVCVGDCTADFAKGRGFRLVRGCPPEPTDIARQL
jgi:uncharacterized protein (DUF362 family)